MTQNIKIDPREQSSYMIAMNPRTKQHLDTLMEKSSDTNISQTFRRALLAYEILVDIYAEDGEIVLRRKNGDEQTFVLNLGETE